VATPRVSRNSTRPARPRDRLPGRPAGPRRAAGWNLDEEKFQIAKAVDSTSVTATRKLGDPEQAPADAATKLQVKAQTAAATAAAKARTTAPKNPPPPKPVDKNPG
jgi:hypothetical protein